MDIILMVIAFLTIPIGIVSCIVPPLPGPIISWAGLICLYFADKEVSLKTVIIWGIATVLVLAADYFLPIVSTKKFGGTKAGIYGGMIGTIVGLIVPIPFGIIWGPLVGAIVGDLYGGNRFKSALKSGFGNFLGFLTATFIKIVVCVIIGVIVVWNIVDDIDLNPFNNDDVEEVTSFLVSLRSVLS